MELVGTIRFAMKATKEMGLYDSRSKETAVEKLGVELGHELARNLASSGQTSIYMALESFWNDSDLGTMAVVEANPTMVILNNCYDCSVSRVGEPPTPCTFKKSLLKTIFQDSLGRPVHVDEVECCKNGGTGCIFRVK